MVTEKCVGSNVIVLGDANGTILATDSNLVSDVVIGIGDELSSVVAVKQVGVFNKTVEIISGNDEIAVGKLEILEFGNVKGKFIAFGFG